MIEYNIRINFILFVVVCLRSTLIVLMWICWRARTSSKPLHSSFCCDHIRTHWYNSTRDISIEQLTFVVSIQLNISFFFIFCLFTRLISLCDNLFFFVNHTGLLAAKRKEKNTLFICALKVNLSFGSIVINCSFFCGFYLFFFCYESVTVLND